MENPDLNADEKTARQLREIADAYEQMGVDHLQRETMRTAADLIEHLTEIELANCKIKRCLVEKLTLSQRREQAAVADLKEAASELTGIGTCVVCKFGPEETFDGPHCGKCTMGNCQFEWRGPQGAEEDEAK